MASWSARRQLIYFFGFFLVLIAAGIFAVVTFWPRASCEDGRRNQNELGIDCGGGCFAVCSNEALPVQTLWSRVLPLGVGTYDLIAFVKNPNPNLQATYLPYEIKFVDQGNALINSVRGEISLWPREEFPIFVSNIQVGKRIPVRAYVGLLGAPRWERASSTSPTFTSPMTDLTITDDNFTSIPIPTVKARLTNNSLKPLSKIDVTVLLSDMEHNVFAASRTFVPRLDSGATTEISFTWPRPFALIPTSINFYPHVAIEPVR